MKQVNYIFFLFLSMIVSIQVVGQSHHYLPMYRAANYPIIAEMDSVGSSFHSSIRPIATKSLKENKFYQDVYERDFFVDKFFLHYQPKTTTPIKLAAYPVFSFVPGFESNQNNGETFETSIGFNVSGMIGEKLDINVNFIRSHSRLPWYVENYAFTQKVIPGQGYAHETDWGYHYRNSTGYISYNPDKHFNFQLGRGKHFWGEGYRSMMLSDFSYNYDYLKISADFWKMKYNIMWAYMKDIYNSTDPPDSYKEKYMAFHHLSWNVTKRWNIQLFETVVWQAQDSLVNRGFDPHYLNPVVFYRPVEFSIGSPDNVLVGVGTGVRISNHIKTYAQIVFDEFKIDELRSGDGWWGNKYALQLGVKYYDAFNIEGLTLQGEGNYIRPFTYSHTNTTQAYGHWNEPMAHPSGANLWEGVFLANYYHKRWYFEYKLVLREQGKDMPDEADNNGSNIFLPSDTRNQDYGNDVGQGVLYTTQHSQLLASWLLSSRTQLRAEASISYWRQQQESGFSPELFMSSIGLKMGLFNQYRDF
jgi:hypothetical protein